MKFGIFYELQMPRPWRPDGEERVVREGLEQIELADRFGFDFVWEVEHHFLEEYSHSPSPESFLAAASQRTRQIRLGHGIVQLTTNHPARVAERIASLDLLSNGRVEMGMGESASITELEPFNVTMENKREIFEEAVRAIIPMFKDGPSEHHGKHFDMPLRMVVPFPPGGAVDLTARFMQQRLSAGLGQPIVVENVAGANGSLGRALIERLLPAGAAVRALVRSDRAAATLRNFALFDAPHVAFLFLPAWAGMREAADVGMYAQTLMLALVDVVHAQGLALDVMGAIAAAAALLVVLLVGQERGRTGH